MLFKHEKANAFMLCLYANSESNVKKLIWKHTDFRLNIHWSYLHIGRMKGCYGSYFLLMFICLFLIHVFGYYMWEWVLSHFSHVWLFVTLWAAACQAPLSMGFFRQEYWNGLPCPPPGDLPDSRIESTPLMSPALAGRFFTTSSTINT